MDCLYFYIPWRTPIFSLCENVKIASRVIVGSKLNLSTRMSTNHLFPLQNCSKWRIWRLHDKTKLSYFEDWYVIIVVVAVVVVVVVVAVVARIKWLFLLWMIEAHFKQNKMMLFWSDSSLSVFTWQKFWPSKVLQKRNFHDPLLWKGVV